jgi:hypothetical protein
MRLCLCVFLISLAFTFAAAQAPKKPALVTACIDQKASYTPVDTVSLSVTIENRGTSTFYVYHPLELGWTGLWYRLLDASGNPVQLKQPVTAPLPPPPLADKSQLVRLEPGYLYGRHLQFALSDYNLSPGKYFIAFKYQSYYHERDGFGLPILTWDDGEIVGNKVEISIR